MPTIKIHMPEQAGLTGQSLWLYGDADGVLLNSGGDTLTESPANSGLFSCTVAEDVLVLHRADIKVGGIAVRTGWLAVGYTTVRDDIITDLFVSQFGTVVLGVVAASPTPTASIFSSDLGSVDKYVDVVIRFTGGANANLVRVGQGSGIAGAFTFDEAWPSIPSAGDPFSVLSQHSHTATQIANATEDLISLGITNGTGDWPTAVGVIQAGLSSQTSVDEVQTTVDANTGYLTSVLARLGAWTGTGINTILGAFRALASKTAALTPTDISTGTTFDNTSDSLEALRDRGDAAWTTGAGAGALAGPYTRTITVTDDSTSDPIELASVRLYRSGETETQETDVNGEVEFTTEAATFSYAVTANGYAGTSGSIAISADGATAVELTALAITPGTGDFTTGFLVAYDDEGVLEPGALVYCELTKSPSGDFGFSFDSAIRTLTAADTTALVEIPGLVKGATYRIWRGQRIAGATNNLFLIPTSAGSTYELPTHFGREQ